MMPRLKKTDLGMKMSSEIEIYGFEELSRQSQWYIDRHIQKIDGYFDDLKNVLKTTEEKLAAIQLSPLTELSESFGHSIRNDPSSDDEGLKRKRKRKKSKACKLDASLKSGDHLNTVSLCKADILLNAPHTTNFHNKSPGEDSVSICISADKRASELETLSGSPIAVNDVEGNVQKEMLFVPTFNSTFCMKSAVSNKFAPVHSGEASQEPLNLTYIDETDNTDMNRNSLPKNCNETYTFSLNVDKQIVTPVNNTPCLAKECMEKSPKEVITSTDHLDTVSPETASHAKSHKIRKKNCLLSHQVLAAAANMSEIRRRSSLNRSKIRASQEYLKEYENFDPIIIEMKSQKIRCSKKIGNKTNKQQASNSFEQQLTPQVHHINDAAAVCDSLSEESLEFDTPIQPVQQDSVFLPRQICKENVFDYPTTHLSMSMSLLAQKNRFRCHEMSSLKTPVSNFRKVMDSTGSYLKQSNKRPLLESCSRNGVNRTSRLTPLAKVPNHFSKVILSTNTFSSKNCLSHVGGSTFSRIKSQSVFQDVEKEKIRQEEIKKLEKEQAVLKKQQLLLLKVEERKKKREERMQKNFEARQQLEKEKAERHRCKEQNRDEKVAQIKGKEKRKGKLKKDMRFTKDPSESVQVVTKTQNSKDKGILPSDSSSIHDKLSMKVLSTVSSNAQTVIENLKNSTFQVAKSDEGPPEFNNTFVKNAKSSSESYKLTPQTRCSSYSNYDISELRDDEDESLDEKQNSKQIPSWALGMRLREAIYMQHFNPPDLSEIFSDIPELSLAELFAVRKPRYNRRTSSAVWNRTLDHMNQSVKLG